MQLFANNAFGTLAVGINASATSLTLGAGEGARFPSPTGGDSFSLTLIQLTNGLETTWEVVSVTARSSDTLTVVRAQEGTTALSWAMGTRIELRTTAGSLSYLATAHETLGAHTGAYLTASNAAALHRSPNAITALAVYDTSKDSDGGAWTERCQHTSWYNESLNGRWLGAYASEALARAAGGITTDFYQLTTDGKFYALSAGSGQTETWRGNKRDFPRLAGIVAEAASLTIYDLTEPGRPMFLRFAIGANNMLQGNLGSLAAVCANLCVGSNSGLFIISLAKDSAILQSTASDKSYKGTIANRVSANGYL